MPAAVFDLIGCIILLGKPETPHQLDFLIAVGSAFGAEYVMLPDFGYWGVLFRAPVHICLRSPGYEAPMLPAYYVFCEKRQNGLERVAYLAAQPL